MTTTTTRTTTLPAAPFGEAVGVIEYYQQTTADYAAWSRGMHMHFGYWRRGVGLFDRESQLAEMTHQVVARLGDARGRVADLGCGVGASSRLVARTCPDLLPVGVSVVPEHIRDAREMAFAERSRAHFICADYTATPFPDRHFEAGFAIESACHAGGADKDGFVREAARILRPGAPLVVADGFLLRPARGRLWRGVVDLVAHNWAVDRFAELDPFVAALARHGFTDIRVEDISWRLAPSAAHIPLVTAGFILRELRRHGRRLGRVRWGHLAACVGSMLVGLARRRFGYFLVTARRAAEDPDGRTD